MDRQKELQEYFKRRDTPAIGSPVGRLIVRLVEKRPTIGLEEAREEAHKLLAASAKRRNYKLPQVLSIQEMADQKAAGAEYWKKRMASR